MLTTEITATMTSREIAELTGSDHHNVLASVRKLIREGVISGNETPYQHPQNGMTYTEFVLNFRDTMVLVSGYNADLRARIIDRWQELEARAPAPAELSRMDLLTIAMDSERERLALADRLAAAAPAIEFVDRYVDSTGLKGFRQVAKALGANENHFRQFLEEEKIMYRLNGEWAPYAQHQAAGRLAVKVGTATGNGHAFNSAKFTPKGVAWVAGEFAKWKLKQKEGHHA